MENILTAFDEFVGHECLSARQSQDYRSVYLDLYAAFRRTADVEKESINEDVVFEIELIKQVEITVDYILLLVEQWRRKRSDGADQALDAVAIQRAVDSSPSLRNKKDLIMDFVDRVSAHGAIDEAWRTFVNARRAAELDALIVEERLKPDETKAFVDRAFRDGAIPVKGTAITTILPPVSRFSPDGSHSDQKWRVLARLTAFFERFFGLGGDAVSEPADAEVDQ